MARKPFVVIDAEILSSSVWAESAPTKLVWITMLILCDTEGYVGAAVPGIARAAGVTLQEATEAIERLQQPDPYSRTKANEGRRIEEAERGWRILNFKEHLSRLSTERQKSRERMRKWRANGWQRRRSEIPFPSVGARCACCNKEFETPLSRFCVLDHDHETGIGRAYVCKSCNRRIADAENGHNAPDHVWEYLKRHGVSQVTAGASRVTTGNREKGIGNRDKTEGTEDPPALPPADRVERAIRLSKEALITKLYGLIDEATRVDPRHRDPTELMRLFSSYEMADGRSVKGVVNAAQLTYERLERSIADAETQIAEWKDGTRPQA